MNLNSCSIDQRNEVIKAPPAPSRPHRQPRSLETERRLMAAAEDHAREKGIRFMYLRIVNLREELPAFYGRLGYVETGTDEFHAESPSRLPCHFVNMTKPL